MSPEPPSSSAAAATSVIWDKIPIRIHSLNVSIEELCAGEGFENRSPQLNKRWDPVSDEEPISRSDSMQPCVLQGVTDVYNLESTIFP
jgi:hypothetical protein